MSEQQHNTAEKTIKELHFDHRWFASSKDAPIERFTKNGEMAPVEWFRQGNTEFNGKYVTQIVYE